MIQDNISKAGQGMSSQEIAGQEISSQEITSMKIYFAGSIRGGRDDQGIYYQLIRGLQENGQVFTEHVGDPDLTQWGDDGPSDRGIYQRDMAWLAEAELVVAEVTVPSLGVGYEIGRAESLGLPVLCLYREQCGRRLSAMISGNPGVTLKQYTKVPEALVHIDRFIADHPSTLRPGEEVDQSADRA